MSEYDNIAAELRRLGWTPTPGRGDHVKFQKEGKRRPITVSRSIGSRGKSYQNMLSDIRRTEPDFQLGKTAKSKKEQMGEKATVSALALSDKERELAQRYKFIFIGATVRFVTPENRDWSKLEDETSVMSLPFVVKEIETESGRLFVSSDKDVISVANDEHNFESVVSPEELIPWETERCAKCGHVFPAGLLDAETRLCPDCAQEEKKETDRLLTDILKALPSNVAKTAREIDSVLRNRAVRGDKDLEALFTKAGTQTFSKCPADIKKEIARHIVDDLQKSSLLNVPETGRQETVTEPEEKTSGRIRIYDCWRSALALINNRCSGMKPSNVSPKEWKDAIREIYATSYTQEDINGLQVFTVQATKEKSASLFFVNSPILYNTLRPFYGDKPFAVRMNFPQGGTRTSHFLTDFTGRNRAVLESLRKAWPDHEDRYAAVAKMAAFEKKEKNPDSNITVDVIAHLSDWMIENKVIGKREDKQITAGIAPGWNIDNESVLLSFTEDRFVPVYLLNMEIHSGDDRTDARIFEKLKKASEKIAAHAKEILQTENPVLVLAKTETENGFTCVNPKDDPRNSDDTMSVTLYFDSKISKDIRLFCNLNKISQETFFDEAVYRMLYSDDSSENNDKQKEDMKTTDNKPATQQDTNPTPAYSSIDSANPASPDSRLADVTTRELLLELRRRGVEFGEVSVPVVVKQAINIDEL